MARSQNHPLLLVSDGCGNITEVPQLHMVGRSIGNISVIDPDDLTTLPDSAPLFELPDRYPIGFDPVTKTYVTQKEFAGVAVCAVAAFPPPGFLQLHHCAFAPGKSAVPLPLFSYSAAGWYKGRICAAIKRIDPQRRHDNENFSKAQISRGCIVALKRFPKNRLVGHLVENCVKQYGCANARNFVMGQYEVPVPISRSCNAACLGCISQQPKSSGVCASQNRIDFTPTVEEICEYVVPHLESVPDAIASFGQGCEGEPLLLADLIEQAIIAIRAQTGKGTININTNGSKPAAIERLCRVGLECARISINSATPDYYRKYYCPRDYDFSDVLKSISILKKHNCHVSINYLIFAGFSDLPSQIDALQRVVASTGIDMIQTRNLNIDPLWYEKMMELDSIKEAPLGINKWISHFRQKFPDVKIGCFNPDFSKKGV